MEQVFVSRDKELRQLAAFLDRAVKGQGQVCFVTGEAGFGKTSLTVEFTRRAQQQYQDLLVAVGACDAQTGISDPYLPFRELLGMLTGEFDEQAAHGLTTEENSRRLHDFLRISKTVIAELAPDLLDIFVPGAGLVTKAGALVARDRSHARRQPATVAQGGTTSAAPGGAPNSDQGRVFEQFTAALVEMAKQRPLIVVLDDLHWVDESSAALLFHLARRIDRSRILIVCTYRPEDVAASQAESRHPVPRLVSELKRAYGDMFVTLGDETPAEVGQFIDGLIDSEPNRLDAAFRHELARRTRGHPLFATELLRDMQERGDLVHDTEGHWVPGASLDWNALPARVEGVIEERFNRVRGEVQEMLTIASVEGETFTVQVISRLKQLDERQLLRVLTQELDRQHRLVSEAGVERVGTVRISQFRFRHQMFQRYLYGNLGESERELLHEDVAGVLELLYAGRTETIAVQLAHHYDRARLDEKAAAAFMRAGRGALGVYAYREAAALARRGLGCLDRVSGSGQHPELRLDLMLLLGEAQRHDGHFTESMATFRAAAQLADRAGANEALAQAALGYDTPRWYFNLEDPVAGELLERALERLGSGDSVLRVYLMAHLARARQDVMRSDELMAMLDEALAMARRIDDPRAMCESVRLRMSLDRSPDRIEERIGLIAEMLEVARRVGDKQLEMELVMFRICDVLAIGDVAAWGRDLEAHRRLADELGEPFYAYNIRAVLTARAVNAGRFDEAERLATEAMASGQQLGVDNTEGVMGMQMFTIRREQGRLREIALVVKHFVGEHGAGAAWRPGLALIYADLDLEAEARAEFERLAQDDFATLPRDSLWQTSLCYLAEVCDYLQDTERAAVLYELLRPYAGMTVVVGNASVCLGATSRFLGQLAALLGRWDAAEAHFRHAVELNQRMDAVPWLAHTRFQYARLLLRRGGRENAERASQLLDAALATAQGHGMHGLLTRIKGSSPVS